MFCQLKSISYLQKENSYFNNLWQSRIKFLCSMKKRIFYLKNRIFKPLLANSGASFMEGDSSPINGGDWVKIRSTMEIKNILDDRGATKGCAFTPDMYKYCGKNYRVYKKVDNFYD
jgi:hypothetical protein